MPEVQQPVVGQEKEWRSVPGWEGLYKVSNFGEVATEERVVQIYGGRKRTVKEKIRKQGMSTPGYLQVHLSGGGMDKVIPVHKIVASAFIGEPPSKKCCVNHIDGNKKNNSSSNLEYCTNQENIIHAVRTGLQLPLRGSKNGSSKLTEEEVAEIRERISRGESQVSIARSFCVTNKNISSIARKKTWSHLESND